MKRTLSLTRESLSSLTPDELAGIHGAALSDPHIACRYIEPDSPLDTLEPTRCFCP